MYCPRCGAENPDGVQLCRSCSWVLTSASPTGPLPDARTSGLAIASLVLALLGFCTFFLTAPLAVILGIVSLFKIERSAGQLKGKGLAISGIAVPAAALILALPIAIILPALVRARSLGQQAICAINLKQFGVAANLYADDWAEKYPTSDKWCDLLERYHKNDKLYVCPSAGQGKCNYAINKNLPEFRFQIEKMSEMILLFESKPGWNQSGGPELLTTENHQGKGCNILFCDGHTEFVQVKDINDLRWTADEKK